MNINIDLNDNSIYHSSNAVKNNYLTRISKTLPLQPPIEHAKITHPTNANTNNYERQFQHKENHFKDGIFKSTLATIKKRKIGIIVL